MLQHMLNGGIELSFQPQFATASPSAAAAIATRLQDRPVKQGVGT